MWVLAIFTQTIGDDAPRLRLKAKIDAPELVVPVSSSSCDVFVAYLGLVELSNTFSLGTNTESQQPVFEKDTLQLSKLSLYRWVHYSPLEAGLPFCALACISCSNLFGIVYLFILLLSSLFCTCTTCTCVYV